MTWWWLSFCDDARAVGSRLLGVALVQARSTVEATMVARVLGCDPGGEVLSLEVPDFFGAPPRGFANRLLTAAEAEAMQALWTPDDPEVKTLGEFADAGDPAAMALLGEAAS